MDEPRQEEEHERIDGIKDGEQVPLTDNIEVTELHCHECNGYIKFALDKGKDGLHTLICPKCGHEHCRIVKNGVVTGDRWDSRNKVLDSQSGGSPNIQYWTIQVDTSQWSSNSWQSVGPVGSQDPYLQNAWGNGQDGTAIVSGGTAYYANCYATGTTATYTYGIP
jgi:hypothetical protein